MDGVTVCIKTFMRPQALRKLVDSIRHHWGDAFDILIADDSPEPTPAPEGTQYFIMPPDSGLSAGRNLLLSQVKTPYVLFLDDDFVVTESSQVNRLRHFLEEHPDVGLAAGAVTQPNGEVIHYEGLLEVRDKVLYQVEGDRGEIDGLKQYDIVLNFFMGRTHVLRDIRWDPELKIAEHTDFFYRALDYGLVIVHDPEVTVINSSDPGPPEYKDYRLRGQHFIDLMLQRRGLDGVVNFSGSSQYLKGARIR